MKIDPNAAAHPHGHLNTCPSCGCGGKAGTSGLTIRAHFAAMCLQGILATGNAKYGTREEIGKIAVEYADALIEALNK